MYFSVNTSYKKYMEDRVFEAYRFQNLPSGELRVSIIESCNMSCEYCHNEGQSKGNRMMSISCFKKIIENSIHFGIRKIRITGGEPTLHPQLVEFIMELQKYRDYVEVGINTNLINFEIVENMVLKGMVDKVVVGVDRIGSRVSKQSAYGKAANSILNNVSRLKKLGRCEIEIDAVYLGDINIIYGLYEWSKEENIVLKIIELTGNSNNDYNVEFNDLKFIMKDKYGLALGIDVHLKEYYLMDDSKMRRVVFYQSHCNRKECDVCKKMHLRVTSLGYAKPCLFREDTEQNLNDSQNFDYCFSKAIYYMGISNE